MNQAAHCANPKPKRQIKLQNMLLDIDFCQRPKVRLLAKKFGPIARLFLLDLIFEIGRSNGRGLDTASIELVASEIGLQNFHEVIESIISLQLLYEDSGLVRCQEIDDCVNRIEETRETWRERKALKKQTEPDLKTSSTGISGNLGESAGVSNLIQSNLNPILELKEGGAGGVLTPEALTEVQRWNEYQIKANRRPIDAISGEALALTYAGRSNELIADIRRSIVNGWKTIQPGALAAQEAAKEPKQSHGKPSKQGSIERIQEIMKTPIGRVEYKLGVKNG